MSAKEEKEESYLDNFKFFSDVTKTFVAISGFVLFGLVIIGWKIENNTTTAIFWAVACLASGGIIGFLFGIPRVLQDNPTVAVNTPVKPAGIGRPKRKR